jgi:two-component system, cell cycle response regulator
MDKPERQPPVVKHASTPGTTVPSLTRLTRLSLIGEKARPASACLVLIHAQERVHLGRKWTLNGEETLTIGRDIGSTIVIDASSVSRSHARIEPRGRDFALVDLKSTNGTYLNDRLVSEQTLRDGDRFKVGPAIFKFFAGGDVEAQYHEEIYNLMVTDALTQASTKRFFLETLEREILRAQRHGRPLSLVMFDIDHFKKINDTYSHLAGDDVLRELGATIRAQVRAEECFARYGGEEFALVLPEASRDGAVTVAEKFRAAVESQRFNFEGSVIPVTISLGVAELVAGMKSPQQLIKAADDKLYESKRSGRNRVSS